MRKIKGFSSPQGDAHSGFSPETLWSDIPDDWFCPICDAPKRFFKLVEEN